MEINEAITLLLVSRSIQKELFYGYADLDLSGTSISSFEEVDSYGGEGQGEDYWRVYKFVSISNEVAYVKFNGYYTSYDGADYRNWFFVEPKQVMVTQYFKV